MSPLKISFEERAGEKWNISALIEPKVLKQLKDYISYENKKGSTSIRFVGYEERSLDGLETSSSEVKFSSLSKILFFKSLFTNHAHSLITHEFIQSRIHASLHPPLTH